MSGTSGVEALFSAVRTGADVRIKELLQRSVPVDARDGAMSTPLIIAVMTNQLPIVKLLLSKGASADAVNREGDTSLTLAVLGDNIPILQHLCACGAVVDRCRPDGLNALMLAARDGKVDIVRALLAAGASVFIKNSEGSSAFLMAAIRNHAPVVTTLLDAGADVNEANHHGYTALMYAAQKGHYSAVEFLISRGARCDERNNLGDTALDLARREGHTAIVELLARHMSTPPAHIGSGSKSDELKVTKRKLKIAEREIVRLQRELARAGADKEAALAGLRAELEALQKRLDEAIAAQGPIITARDAAVAQLDSERADWRAQAARYLDDKELARALAEKAKREAIAARDAAIAARDAALAECAARVARCEAEANAAILAAESARDAALTERDVAMTLQRQAECVNSNLKAERDRAVDGWARAEAQVKVEGAAAPYAPHHHVLSSEAVLRRAPSVDYGDIQAFPAHKRSWTGLVSFSDPKPPVTPVPRPPLPPPAPIVAIADPETPSAVRTHAITHAAVEDPSGIVSALAKMASISISERWEGLTFLHAMPVTLQLQLSKVLVPAAVWPVRPPVLVDGDGSSGSWFGATASARDALHTLVYDVVGSFINSPDTKTAIESITPFSVVTVKHSGKVAVGHEPPTTTHSVSFVIASGQSVLLLKGLIPIVPVVHGVTDTVCAEVAVGVTLCEDAPHPNLMAALHSFAGGSEVVKLWLDVGIVVPPTITYTVWPHYPLSLHMLVSARLASHRTTLTEVEVLTILTQVLAALQHLVDHGYVHRNVSVDTLRFDCRRLQSPTHPNSPHPTGGSGNDWTGVELGIHSPIILCELQHCKRVVQTTGMDYIFGEYSQLEGSGPCVGSAAPEVHKHSRPSVPVPSGGHAVTLKDMLAKNDVFALGYAMFAALLGDTAMAASFPDVTTAAFREWDLPELPAHLSRGTKTLLTRMVACDPARRPSIRDAFIRCQVLLWSQVGHALRRNSPESELTAASIRGDVDSWLVNRRLELAFGLNAELTSLQTALYTEFLLSVTADDVLGTL